MWWFWWLTTDFEMYNYFRRERIFVWLFDCPSLWSTTSYTCACLTFITLIIPSRPWMCRQVCEDKSIKRSMTTFMLILSHLAQGIAHAIICMSNDTIFADSCYGGSLRAGLSFFSCGHATLHVAVSVRPFVTFLWISHYCPRSYICDFFFFFLFSCGHATL